MTWPNATDYNAAVQNPQLCFRDEDLRQGQAIGDLLGLPRPHSGSFADVYQIQGADGQNWAVKCFTRPVTGLQARYQAISEHLQQAQRAFMVEFHFHDEGVGIGGQWYPLVKMRWVEGFRLNEFIREHLNKPTVLDRLAQLWLRLAQELREAGMAHGDLQHGNVLLVPASNSNSLALKLIDYDGMFVPSLGDRPSGEYGHPNYQHPRRQPEVGYNRKMDRFSLLLIYTALRSLRSGGEGLWTRFDNQENLLFREEDFLQPSNSQLWRELWEMPEREARDLVGHLLLASQGPLETVPRLDQLIDGNSVRQLTEDEKARIDNLLNSDANLSRGRKGAVPPPLPGSDSVEPRRLKTRTIAVHADSTVETAALTDTKTIQLGGKKTRALPPPLPTTFRRSAAEIELDARPPTDADPLESRLSYSAWVAGLCAIALITFLVINMIAGPSTKEQGPATTTSVEQAAVEKMEESPLSVRESAQPPSSKIEKTRAPLTPKSQVAQLADPDRPATHQVMKPQVRLNIVTPIVLSVEAGSKGILHVGLDRNGYTGAMEVQLTDLPANVTASPVAVPAPKSSATVMIETKIDADKRAHPIKLLVRIENRTVDVRNLTLLVRKPHGRQETVHFRTVDHMQLAATLYHGWRGKRGATVLMLHDLGSSRSSPGWKRLAEALRAEGHTVLTFDFRGHGDSKKVTPQFWKYPVNKSLPPYITILPAEKQSMQLEADEMPFDYLPWLVEDIAAARTYLDLRNDEPAGSVNSFNLVVLGAGRAAALGSLWLAAEGLRFNGSEAGKLIRVLLPEKLSVVQAVWIGMADPLKLNPFGIHSWLQAAHDKPEVPITFIYGDEDSDTSTLLSEPIRNKHGREFLIRGARLSGQKMLDRDETGFVQIENYLVKTLQALPPISPTSAVNWAPRNLKSLRSFWRMEVSGSKRQVRWFVAKRSGEETLQPVPFHLLGIPIKGLAEPSVFPEKKEH